MAHGWHGSALAGHNTPSEERNTEAGSRKKATVRRRRQTQKYRVLFTPYWNHVEHGGMEHAVARVQ